MEPRITFKRFIELLPSICDRETSSDPNGWTSDNPLWGHCAVVSLVAQNLFGGKLYRASLEGTKFAFMRSHYWNMLPFHCYNDPHGEVDFTASQFGGGDLNNLVGEPRTREYVLYDPETRKPREIMGRYKLLAFRLARTLSNSNPLFDNPIYKRCFYKALESPCQKMKFGCVLGYFRSYECICTMGWEYTETCNETIEPLKSLCEPNCIRLHIPSRTDSMIGACGHAEELALWISFKYRSPNPSYDSEMYVAGIYPNGLPYIKEKNEFTCLRCAIPIYHAGVKRVFVPTINGWQSLSGEECVRTALAYATGEKKVK